MGAGGQGPTIFVVASSPPERTETEAMGRSSPSFSGAPKGRSLAVGPCLTPFSLRLEDNAFPGIGHVGSPALLLPSPKGD